MDRLGDPKVRIGVIMLRDISKGIDEFRKKIDKLWRWKLQPPSEVNPIEVSIIIGMHGF